MYNDLNYVYQVYLICIYVQWPSVPITATLAITAPMVSNAPMAICAIIAITDNRMPIACSLTINVSDISHYP